MAGQDAAPEAEPKLEDPAAAADTVKKLILALVDKHGCDAIEIGGKLKDNYGIANIKTMDPDQAENAKKFLESALKKYEAKAKKDTAKKKAEK